MKRYLAAAVLMTTWPIPAAQAQSKPMEPSQDSSSFEVVSIKPADPGDRRTMIRLPPGGRFEANGVTVKLLMRVAYDVQDFQIVGLPSWAESDRFIVDAKTGEAKTPDATPENPSTMTDEERKALEARLHTRIRTMLADRFKLKAHLETREMPVYALVIAKGGSKLKPAAEAAGGPPRRSLMGGRGQLTGTGATLDMLIHLLSNATGRTIIDRTGLKGVYDFKLEWTPDPGEMGFMGGPPPPGGPPGEKEAPPAPDGPSLFTAVQEQLGLRLEATKGPVQVVVVDHIEKPSAN
jgi:uncharacterized protein (TIGR03435 family)